MIEEGYIDKYSHQNDKTGALCALYRFNETIAYTMQFVLMHPDTLLIVTADHETGGLQMDGDTYAYTTTSHTNADVSVFAFGAGADGWIEGHIDNTDIAKRIASVYGDDLFGEEK